jgi:hypothetical protein
MHAAENDMQMRVRPIGVADDQRLMILGTKDPQRCIRRAQHLFARQAFAFVRVPGQGIGKDWPGCRLPPGRLHSGGGLQGVRLAGGGDHDPLCNLRIVARQVAGLGPGDPVKHMESIETAAGYAAGFGIKLWVIIQDLAQLKRYYKDGWETFLGNAGVIQAFGNSDATTLDYLSKKIGEVEVTQTIRSLTSSLTASTNDPGDGQRMQNLMQNRGAFSFLNPVSLFIDDGGTGQSATSTSAQNEQVQRTPLMLPDEIERFFRREALTQLVSIKGLPPFILDRVLYYDSPLFTGLYEPTEEEREGLAQAQATWAAVQTRRQADTRQAVQDAQTFVRSAQKMVEAALRKAR